MLSNPCVKMNAANNRSQFSSFFSFFHFLSFPFRFNFVYVHNTSIEIRKNTKRNRGYDTIRYDIFTWCDLHDTKQKQIQKKLQQPHIIQLKNKRKKKSCARQCDAYDFKDFGDIRLYFWSQKLIFTLWCTWYRPHSFYFVLSVFFSFFFSLSLSLSLICMFIIVCWSRLKSVSK